MKNLKTFRFNEFKKINEDLTTDETVDNIDDLGTGEEVNLEDEPETVDGTDINADSIDVGDGSIRFETLGTDEQKKMISDKLQDVRNIVGNINTIELNKLYKTLDDYVKKYSTAE